MKPFKKADLRFMMCSANSAGCFFALSAVKKPCQQTPILTIRTQFYKVMKINIMYKSGCTKSAENTLKCRNFCTVTDAVALGIEAVTPHPPIGGEEYERIARRLCETMPERPNNKILRLLRLFTPRNDGVDAEIASYLAMTLPPNYRQYATTISQ